PGRRPRTVTLNCFSSRHDTFSLILCFFLNSYMISESTNKYIPVTVPMSWSSAQSYCRETYTDLTSMRSLQEKEEIMKVTDQSEWWIGLYRDSWTWSDQTKSTLRMWAPTDPNGAGKDLCVGNLGTGNKRVTCK
uniref:C-type lectin domain-containing protein n=1 Tax=Amphilophus citrinellus TaxID=61819 RepID=A0A3Q0RFV0_AMPCI